MKNITFLLGAGASYNSCPIWKEQGEKMIELATKYIGIANYDFEQEPKFMSENDIILWNIGYFGKKAEKYGTVDTYAKKLYLNGSGEELSRLKSSVSIFFTLWHLTDDCDLKSRIFESKKMCFEEIDKRYISLLAAITEKNNNDIQIKQNIRFVTWNYDLQLESAFGAFITNSSFENLSKKLKFSCDVNNENPMQICHLNGYHGFYNTDRGEIDFLTVSKTKNINEILDSIKYVWSNEVRRSDPGILEHINYAWEENKLAEKTREEAKRIFSETDILVIIGYSFPNFNKDIDKKLFDNLKGRNTTIYYQDPNASETFLYQLVDKNETEIICDRIRKDNFYLPYEF